MQTIFRPLLLYFAGKKIAEVSNGTYEIDSGDDPLFGLEGCLGMADGATTVKVSARCLMPLKGMASQLELLIVNKKQAQLGIPLGQYQHQFDARLTTVKFDWDHKSGHAIGDFSFFGWSLQLTGG